MKHIYFLLFTFFALNLSFGQVTELYFSKYGEGSSYNKFIEIYNGTAQDIDLSLYSISTCSNGCNITGEFDYPDNVTFQTGTTIASGDVYIVADSRANAAASFTQGIKSSSSSGILLLEAFDTRVLTPFS